MSPIEVQKKTTSRTAKLLTDAVATMGTVTPADAHGRTMRMDIHDVVRELNSTLGPTLVAGLAGVKDRKLPIRWAKPDGPITRPEASNRLTFAHRQWTVLFAADGAAVARQWLIGGNPYLRENTPISAIREDRHSEVAAAVQAFVTGNIDM